MEMDVEVKILGPGCKKCAQVADTVRRAAKAHGIAVQIEEIARMENIDEYGQVSTPAVVIGGDLKCTGRVPEAEEIVSWLKKYLAIDE